MKKLSVLIILLLIPVLGSSQGGLIPKLDKFPRQIVEAGDTLTVITNTQVKNLNKYKKYYEQSSERVLDLSLSLEEARKLLSDSKTLLQGKNIELSIAKAKEDNRLEVLVVKNDFILGLEKSLKWGKAQILVLEGILLVLTGVIIFK